MRWRPIILLLLLLGGASALALGQRGGHRLYRLATDSVDQRPVRRVLVLGNSRTYYHDMPDMIRDIADSAGDRQRLDISVDAQPGASLETLWEDGGVQSLLAQRWDDVIVQGESRAESSDDQAQSFQRYGAQLLARARKASGTTWLVVNWNYDARLWDDGDPSGEGRYAYFSSVQSASQQLGERTGARLADIGRLWGEVQAQYPRIALTEDGNHPTLAGSYLFALLLYRDLSGRDVGAVGYVPAGLDPDIAAKLRQSVAAYAAVAT